MIEHTQFNERDGLRSIEVLTDGHWIRLGNDPMDNRCLTFRYEESDDLYHKLRRISGAEQFTIEDERHSDEKYVAYGGGVQTLRVFRGRHMVLESTDHEFGSMRYAMKTAAEVRREDYDIEQIARGYIETFVPFYWDIEELDTSPNTATVKVSDDHGMLRENFLAQLEDDEYLDNVNVEATEDGCLRYSFKVYARQLENDVGGFEDA